MNGRDDPLRLARETRSVKSLAVLARSDDPEVAYAVAINPAATDAILTRVLDRHPDKALTAVAVAKKATPRTLSRVARHPNAGSTAVTATRRAVTEHRDHPATTMAAFPVAAVWEVDQTGLAAGRYFQGPDRVELGEIAGVLGDGFDGTVAELEAACRSITTHSS